MKESHCVLRMTGRFQKKMAIRLRFKVGMHYSEVRIMNQLRGLWQGSEWTETAKNVKACGRVGEAMGKRNLRQVSTRKPKAGTICLKHFLVFSSRTIHFSFLACFSFYLDAEKYTLARSRALHTLVMGHRGVHLKSQNLVAEVRRSKGYHQLERKLETSLDYVRLWL